MMSISFHLFLFRFESLLPSKPLLFAFLHFFTSSHSILFLLFVYMAFNTPILRVWPTQARVFGADIFFLFFYFRVGLLELCVFSDMENGCEWRFPSSTRMSMTPIVSFRT